MQKVKSTGLSGRTLKTKNNMGSPAYELPLKERLVTSVLTCFFREPNATTDMSEELVKATRELAAKEPEFVAKLAVFTRKEFHMRTVSQVLAAEVAHAAKGNEVVRKMTRQVIERPDDMTNILAYHFDTFGARKPQKTADGKPLPSTNPVPRGLRRGIADAFGRFEEYHLAKYKGEGNSVKLRDALLIARPKPKDDSQAALWKRLIEGKLEVPVTRETVLSEEGQSKEVWEKLIDTGMGYMAVLRNLGNFIKNKISESHMAKVVKQLTSKEAVAKSKQLPFRFFSAYKYITNHHTGERVAELTKALDTALGYSVENMPRLPGVTFMTADESGSMVHRISEKSEINRIDIGNLLMAIGDGFCDKSIATVFGDKTTPVTFTKTDTILKKMEKIEKVGSTVGVSTMMSTAIDYLIDNNLKVDRIIVFSDMQAYETSLGFRAEAENKVEEKLNEYRRKINPDVWVHSIDLSGQGTAKTKGPKVNLIAGWSDRVFEFIAMSESSGTNLIETINNYKL